jgi:monofunctional biosynthetic peptidoglycan transglycosylase
MRKLTIAYLRTNDPLQTEFMKYRGMATRTDIRIDADEWIPLERISPYLLAAIIKAEDPKFFRHRGIDLETILRKTALALASRKKVGGVSSITQQTARNLFLVPVRSYWRKLREAVLSLAMEKKLSKTRILEIYLNTIEWGDGIWGCAAASKHYFGKDPTDLEPFESIFLVSLVPAPRAVLSGRNLQRMWQSQMEALHLMYLSELLTLRQFAEVLQRAKSVLQSLAEGMELQKALNTAQTTTELPLLPIINQDERCSCTFYRIVTTECELRREVERRSTLEKRFGKMRLYRAIMTNDYAILSDSQQPKGLHAA